MIVTPEATAILAKMKADVLADILPDVRADMMAAYAETSAGIASALDPIVEARASEAAEKLAKQMADAQVNAMAYKINQGVELGLSASEIGMNLLQVSGLNTAQAKIIDSLSGALAQAECPPLVADLVVDAAKALGVEGRLEDIVGDQDWRLSQADRSLKAIERGDTHKRWLDMGDGDVCEACEGNAAEGWIPIDDVFSSGDEYPEAHINCRCELETGTSDDGESD